MLTEIAQTASGLYKPPEIPNKFDIIPIHNSDRASFKHCRRYFDWSSPTRHNLSLRADTLGINTDLFFGTGIHYALEQYYHPGLRRDPVESWRTWFDVQWRGGTVTEDWLDKVYDLAPKAVGGVDNGKPDHRLYLVRGLQDILPDADSELYDELFTLGVEMMTAYKPYAARKDEFEVLVVEHDFSIPVWDFENECILTAVDLREQSPNYGKRLEVHSRGRMDAIWQKPSGKYGIIDHKTSSRIDDDYFDKLETDEQVTSYAHAAEIEAKYYGLPYAGFQVEEVVYNVLRKTFPRPPTMVRSGLFSVDRQNESTTYEMLMEFIQQNNIDIESLDEKHQAYIAYVRDSGVEQWFIRKLVRRNRSQLQQAGYRLYLESLDMLDPDLRIYPNLSNNYRCMRCQFRAPCLMIESGNDWQSVLESNYTHSRDR